MKSSLGAFFGVGAALAAGAAFMFSRRKGARPTQGAAGPAVAAQPTSAVMTGTQYPVPPVPQVPSQVPQVTIPQIVPSGDYQQKVANALAPPDPVKMRSVAAELRKAGNTTAAQALEAMAMNAEMTQGTISAAVQAVQQILTPPQAPPAPQPQPAPPVAAQPGTQLPPSVPVSTPQPVPQPPPPAPPSFTIPPIPGVTTQPTTIPVPISFQLPQPVPTMPSPETILTGAPAWPETNPSKVAVAQQMNLMLAAKKPWAEDTALVKTFQRQEGLTPVDGLYGPGTATRLAQQYGIIPTKPYYWSKTTSKVPQQKADYRAALTALAARDPVRAGEWAAAANV